MSKLFAHKQYMLWFLVVIGTFNSLDKMAVGLAFESIKLDFGLNDGQIGLMAQISVLCGALVVLPVGYLADRGHRLWIITASTTIWALSFASLSIAGSFGMLLAARALSSMGDAGCNPPAHSLVAARFDRSQRARAVATLLLATSLATIFGGLIGGWLIHTLGWRVMALVIGLTGLALTALFRLTLTEPPTPVSSDQAVAPKMSLSSAIADYRQLLRIPTFRLIAVTFMLFMVGYRGIESWMPVVLIRSFDMSPAALGTWTGAVYGVAALIGTFMGGYLMSRFVANNERLQLRLLALQFAILMSLAAIAFFSGELHLTLVLLTVYGLVCTGVLGPMYSIAYSVIAEGMRASAAALIGVFALVAASFSPLAIGILSDVFTARWGQDALRMSIIVLSSAAFLLAGWVAWLASRSALADVRQAEANVAAAMATAG